MSTERFRRALARVASAEQDLDSALADLEETQRAQKRIITSALRVALDNVRKARTALDGITSPLEK